MIYLFSLFVPGVIPDSEAALDDLGESETVLSDSESDDAGLLEDSEGNPITKVSYKQFKGLCICHLSQMILHILIWMLQYLVETSIDLFSYIYLGDQLTARRHTMQ